MYSQHVSYCMLLSALALTLTSTAISQAAIINTPGLTSVRVWEATGPITAYNFPHNVGPMVNQIGLGTLGPNNNDFSPLVSENYDVFYSDVNGNFNVNGNYVTVEAVFPNPSSGGGLNLAAVDLIIGGVPWRADVLASFVGLGTNFIASSVVNSVDFDNSPLAPTTATTMGSTVIPPAQHLRVTVTWSHLPVPEPGTLVLGATGMFGMLLRRRSLAC
jgi:hypothetical protein